MDKLNYVFTFVYTSGTMLTGCSRIIFIFGEKSISYESGTLKHSNIQIYVGYINTQRHPHPRIHAVSSRLHRMAPPRTHKTIVGCFAVNWLCILNYEFMLIKKLSQITSMQSGTDYILLHKFMTVYRVVYDGMVWRAAWWMDGRGKI